MPIPTPNPKESKSNFISRCVSTLKKIDPNREDKQIVAICYDSWRKKRLSKFEELKFKK